MIKPNGLIGARLPILPTSVWEISPAHRHEVMLKAYVGDTGQLRAQDGHFADSTNTASIFSPTLAEQIVLAYSQAGDLILDPFAGGGTRAIMAALHGRRYLGLDIRNDEVDRVNARLRDLLVESVRNEQGHNTLVYPIVWLSRHAIEVALKGLLVTFRDELDMAEKFKLTHDLVALRSTAEKLVRNLGRNDEPELARLREAISRIAALDPDATRFRYPTTKDGTPSTSMEAINLDVLEDEVKGILTALDAELDWVQAEGQARQEEAWATWWFALSEEEREEHVGQEEELYRLWDSR